MTHPLLDPPIVAAIERAASAHRGRPWTARGFTDLNTPTPVATGLVSAGTGWLLLSEALPERVGGARTANDFRAIGHALAALHEVTAERFGLADFDGFFGPLPQDNQPVHPSRWADFYAERRIEPLLRLAVSSGNLPGVLAAAQSA